MASIKLVAIAKDEAAYLAEWIYHHLSIGIQEIDVYLNGITDNSYRLMRLINAKHKNVKFYNADYHYLLYYVLNIFEAAALVLNLFSNLVCSTDFKLDCVKSNNFKVSEKKDSSNIIIII